MKDEVKKEITSQPVIIRVLESPWLIVVSIVFALAWAGSYFLVPEEKGFLGSPLSMEHHHLKDDCRACHRLGKGVPNSLCAAEECHFKTINGSLHETLPEACFSCHPEHWHGEPIPRLMTDEQCKDCHEAIWAEEEKSEESEVPEESEVSKEIFSHRVHRGYECVVCHGTGEGSINVPKQDLFKMNTCTKCHVESQCMLCHSYHDKKRKPSTSILK